MPGMKAFGYKPKGSKMPVNSLLPSAMKQASPAINQSTQNKMERLASSMIRSRKKLQQPMAGNPNKSYR